MPTLALVSDKDGDLPLSTADQKIFVIENGALVVDPGSLAPNKDYSVTFWLMATSTGDAKAYSELSFLFVANLFVNTPPSLDPADFGVTSISVNTSTGDLHTFTAGVTDFEDDAVALTVQGSTSCNCITVTLPSSS